MLCLIKSFPMKFARVSSSHHSGNRPSTSAFLFIFEMEQADGKYNRRILFIGLPISSSSNCSIGCRHGQQFVSTNLNFFCGGYFKRLRGCCIMNILCGKEISLSPYST